jgi:hypothetical protein
MYRLFSIYLEGPLVKESPPGTSLIYMVVQFLEIDPLLLSLLVADSRKFVEYGTFTYTTWIVQEFHFFLITKLKAIIYFLPPPSPH